MMTQCQRITRLNSAASDVSTNPGEEFAKFCRSHARPSNIELVDDIIFAVKDAFDRAARGYPARTDLASDAKTLAKAAAKFCKAIPLIERLHFHLRLSNSLSDGVALWTQAALDEGRAFDASTEILARGGLKKLLVALQIIEDAATRLTDPEAPAPVLSRGGRPPDEARRALGIELASLWLAMTGKAPGYSGEDSMAAPVTNFGKFVALAAKHHPYGSTSFEKGSSSFLREAGTDLLGDETPK